MEITQRILIDTNIYSHAFRGESDVTATLRSVSSIALSAISIGELLSGFRGGSREKDNRRALAMFLDSPRVTVLPIDESTGDYYGAILDQLRRQGVPIPTNDLWIAATAKQHGLALYTKDRHFEKVAGLLLVD
ncbi:MAG: type II toxin-antitoxin system VapC family toxin [Candidatus Omnitrophica bacterium]|nr:type II toxin-antitoxin system VapC family toxin [Candidatus Omnitrophota bacterium]